MEEGAWLRWRMRSHMEWNSCVLSLNENAICIRVDRYCVNKKKVDTVVVCFFFVGTTNPAKKNHVYQSNVSTVFEQFPKHKRRTLLYNIAYFWCWYGLSLLAIRFVVCENALKSKKRKYAKSHHFFNALLLWNLIIFIINVVLYMPTWTRRIDMRDFRAYE
jgi:hypothetical protein